MPTNQNAYNTRLTSESLEKRFRDTFTSQGGAELVDDLYASGVIVPVVDFTAAAQDSTLDQNLQNAWDFSTGQIQILDSAYQDIVSTAGFWLVDLTATVQTRTTGAPGLTFAMRINDGSTSKVIWAFSRAGNQSGGDYDTLVESKFVVFLRAGDTLQGRSQNTDFPMDVWYRQIADVSGNLVNPLGFTSS